jgi:nucleolin
MGNPRENEKKNPPSKTLFIGNMSWEMTDRDLNNLFRGIRNVIDVRVAIDRRTRPPRGFAHADFIDVKSAMEAEKVLQGKETYGRKLKIDYSYGSSVAPRNQARDEGQDRRGRGGFERRSEGTSNRTDQYQDKESNQGNI